MNLPGVDQVVPRAEWALAVVVGLLAALVSVLLLQASLVWFGLVLVGLVVFCGSFVFLDAKSYWLTIFALSVPVQITKLLFYEPEDVERLKELYDIYITENLVPELYLSDLPLMVLLFIWFEEILRRQNRIKFPRPFLLSVAFLLWSLVTLIWARAPILGSTWIFYEVKLFVMFLWFVNASLKRETLRLLVAAIILGLAIQGATTIYSYFAQTGTSILGDLFGRTLTESEQRRGPERGGGAAYVYEEGALLRGTGTVGPANNEAKYFVMVIPLAVVSTLFHGPALLRALSLLAFGLGTTGLVLTFSRGGMVCALVALAVLPFFIARRGLIDRKTFAAVIITGLLALAMATPFLYDYLTTRPGFLEIRFQHISYGLEAMFRQPFSGFGINNFNASVSERDYGGVFASMPIHNHYLRIGFETGLFGLLLLLSFNFWVAIQAYRSVRLEDRFLATTAMALLAGLLGIFVYWLDDLFYDVVIRTQFWLTLGMVMAIRHMSPGTDPGARPA